MVSAESAKPLAFFVVREGLYDNRDRYAFCRHIPGLSPYSP
jgi:hypothetical protein